MAYHPKLKRDLSNLEEEAKEAEKYHSNEPGTINRIPGEIVGYLYRVYDQRYSTCSFSTVGHEEYGLTDLQLEIEAFPVKKWTPTGATLWKKITLRGEEEGKRHKHVRLGGRKEFASRTPQRAIEQFRGRRLRQIEILKGQIAHAKLCVELTHASELEFA